MNLLEQISEHFSESIATKTQAQVSLTHFIAKAGELMAKCLEAGHKILSCGNGGSAADSQHFSSELINRYERERKALPAIALTTDTSILTSIGNDYDYHDIFARQISALGQPGDILLAISTSGNSKNVLNAVSTAKMSGLNVVALTGKDGGKLTHLLNQEDIEIRVSANKTSRVQETHLLIIHCLCDVIDSILFCNNRSVSC